MADQQNQRTPPPVFIISGGAGALGKHVARIALSQFRLDELEIVVIPQVRAPAQLADALEQVTARGGIILHTMVDPVMRRELVAMAAQRNILAIDTIGSAVDQMSTVFGLTPLGQPGLYHGEEEAYMERIKAIEYTVDHDDGRNPSELHEADVVLTGVSRVGKTPLSIYLSVLGWKVANVPLVAGIGAPDELFQIDRRRVVGLIIDPGELSEHRRWRQRRMANTAGRSYTDPSNLYDELEMARRVFRKGGFAVIDVTGKPVEESADEIIALVTRWFQRTIELPRRRGREGR